ncbi:MAG: carboxypeptidase-like regulatory domain-containing protein [Candidatus Diapherotrites archaeon]
MGDIIKDFYFATEDKWYAVLDFLDTHGLPVYKIIDPIDKRIPSFALFALLVLFGLGFLFLSFGGFIQGENVHAIFQVVDEESSPLPNVPIAFSYNTTKETITTDSEGKIDLFIPSGTKVDYQIDLSKYEIVKKSVTIAGNQMEIIQLSELQTQNLSKTIKLVNSVGQPILGDAELSFACSTAYGTPPQSVSGTGGLFVITPNADCIPLSVTIHSNGYEDVQSYPLTAEKDVYSIILTPKLVKDAAIVVTVLDQTTQPVPGLNVSVQLGGVIVDNGNTDALGTTTFSVGAGEYTLVASDPINGVFTSAQDSVIVASGSTVTTTIIVNKNAASMMNVTVIDKKTNTALNDAIIKLKQEKTILTTITTGTDGKATIPIPDKTIQYTVSASKNDYIPSQQTVSGGQTNVSFALDKATGTNTAKLKVFLVDQDEEPIADAKVVLYDADTGFLSPYEAVLTDVNGVGTFNSVISGNYQAFAYKSSLTGFSEEHFFDISDPETYDYQLTLEIPDGVVSVHVMDQDGMPVPFAKVSVYNAFKNKLIGSDLTDSNGTYVLPSNGQDSKADKDVFLVVSKTNYATLTTIQKPILPNSTQSFNAILFPTKPKGNISIELVGLFTTDGKIVTGVGKGKDYIAKFLVEIPEEQDELDDMTIHIRTGDKDIVEKDEWYISSINMPKAGIVKGSSWDPANGVNVDGESITFGNAKWINAHIFGPNPGVYELEATLHVRTTALPQDILFLSYKVHAENSEILRDPKDANPADELYAATKSASYQVGVTTVCDSQFCFDASILDEDKQLIEDVTEQYNASVFQNYTLTFNLLNNGNAFHTNSNLRIKSSSEGFDFTTYEIYNADALKLSGTVNDYEFPNPIPMGDFTPQKKIGGSIHFKPKQVGTTIVTIELVSDYQVVFSKNIQINVNGDKELSVTIEPENYPSNVPFTLNLHVEDSATQNEVEHALVSLTTNLGVVLATKYTDAAGNAEIEMPAQLPGKKITLKVEKEEYNPHVQIITISDKVVSLKPETLGININVKTESEKSKTFTITNEMGIPVVVKQLSLLGNLEGFIDKEKTNSNLLPYEGIVIQKNSTLEVNLKSVLTPEALNLIEHEDVEATLNVEIESYGNEYLLELPIKYSLSVASEVDDPTCLNIAPRAWITSTDGQSVTFEFQIQNNCSIGGIPAPLKELKTKANWAGNELGETTLSVFEQTSPTPIGAAKVRSGFYSNVLPTIPAGDILIARLDFAPYGGIKGEGIFDVEIQATNPLEGKPQLLSGKINTQITVVNLVDCITYDKEIIDLQPGKKDTITIETKGCGAPVEFALQTDLAVASKTFKLQGDDKKAIEVGDNELDQGQYPIYVNVEGFENKVPSQNKILRARIRDPNACLQLNRYEFDVYDDPKNDFDGFDTARLDNYCTEQRVNVVIEIPKDWKDSLCVGLQAGIVAGVVTMVSNLLEGKDAFGGEKDEVTETEGTPGNGEEPKSDLSPDSGEKNSGKGTEFWIEEGDVKSTAGNAITFKNATAADKYAKELTINGVKFSHSGSTITVVGATIEGGVFDGGYMLTIVPADNEKVEAITKKYSVESIPTSPITGFVAGTGETKSLDATGGGATQQSSLGSKIGESLVGGILNKVVGAVSLGTGNPFVSFAVTTIVAGLTHYFMSDDEEFDVTIIGKDLVIDEIKVIGGEKGSDEKVKDKDIEVKEDDVAILPKIALEQPILGRVEAFNLTFTNISKFVNETIFRNLLVTGERFVYAQDVEYKNKIPSPDDLKEEDILDSKARFHLQYNSFTPETLIKTGVPPIALDCDTFSEKTGKTGINAAPRVAFAWNFNDIDAYACDQGQVDNEGNSAHIYCDATQFSIELIQKVQLLREFIEANAPFECPLEDQLSGVKTQPIPAADIGIASLSVDKTAPTDVNMIVGIENKTPAMNNAKVSISYKIKDALTAPITQSKMVLIPIGGSKVSLGFTATNLPEGHYEITATIIPEDCENCSNSVPASDTITTEFFIGTSSALVACQPFTTLRLSEFIAANEEAGIGVNYPNGIGKDEILELVSFRAHLMQDRFSPDFFTDFDRYANKVSFFDAPSYYTDPMNGIALLFKNRNHWVVKREGGVPTVEGYLLPGPGIYDVTLDINFDGPEMSFVNGQEPDAIVNVLLEKTSTIEDNSPFYSLPFNGLIGTDDGQGRVGYGVNFSGEKIVVNDEPHSQVVTVDIPDSTPVASVQSSTVNAYTILNSLERGNILTVTKNSTNSLSIKWSPSFATPVMMKIGNKSAQSDVFGFYSVGVNNDTSQSYIGVQGNPWYGVGANCRDFEDKSLLDSYNRKYDTSAINTDCALVGPQENISYGFEWCGDTIHTGNVFLKSVFYTPQESLSSINRTAWKSEMQFIGEGISGAGIPLNGTNAIPGNTPGDTLTSIEEILNLITERAVCVRNSGAKTEFFWNPKEVLNAIESQEKNAGQQCIVK